MCELSYCGTVIMADFEATLTRWPFCPDEGVCY